MQFSKYRYIGLLSFIFFSHSAHSAPIENGNLPTTAYNTQASTTPINMNWEMMQKNEKLEEDVRKLRGLLEEHDYQIDQLKKDLQNHYADLDQRMQLLEQKAEAENSATTSNTESDDATKTDADQQPKKEETKPVISEKDAYTMALDAYKSGGAKQAILPMQNFIQSYPKSEYLGNAHFWLAEFYLAITPADYNKAKQNYEIVAKQFPQSAKSSHALYQLYSIEKNIDKNMVSANLYKQQLLKAYPKSKEAGFFQK